ncbi:uncharacterized protein LOC112086622 [Eutrema salsugineum]|uniref:uncharacterized protein LOC112086622 n=1 Tax=Eutrema salsugineum TaxID=72664 RepID=UPI000CECEA24|nr:uncharacterized protein LOC112086622 [Eutrema salsugineum]
MVKSRQNQALSSYTNQCPHHDFSEASLLSTLFRGPLPKIRNQLDTASNGNFLEKEINAAIELVENLVMSKNTYGEDFERANSKELRMEKDMRELQNKVDKVPVATQKPIHFLGEFDEQGPSFENVNEDGLTQEEINYIGNQNRYQRFNNYNSNQNLSYKNPNPKQQFVQQQQSYGQQQQPVQSSNFSSQPQQPKFPPGFSQQQFQPQAVQQQQPMGPDMCGVLQQLLQGQQRFESGFTDFGSKYASMQHEIRELKQHQASTSRGQGVLPRKAKPNHKEYVNAITLRNGKELAGPEKNIVLIEDNEQIGGEAAPRDEQEDEVSKKEKAKEVDKEPEPEKPYVQPHPYQPKLPFPGRFKKQILDKENAVFEKQLENTQMTLPIIEDFLMIPQVGKFLEDVILNKTKELQGMVILRHECSAIIQRITVPRKLSDPGSFTLPCAIGPLKFASCLCDFGASLVSYKPAKISLVLADRSVRLPIGLLEDFPLKIGEIEIPTDFIVLEMDEEPVDPIIFERPFLSTAGVIIDVRGGMIELHIGSETMKFNVKEMMKKPTIGGQVFYIETMEELADELLEELNTEDPLQVVLTKDQGEHGYLAEESEAYKRFLDQPKEVEAETKFLEIEPSGHEV